MRLGKIDIGQNQKSIHQMVYVFLLIGIVASMPLSKYVTSVFQLLLLLHWMVRGDYAEKLRA